MQSGSIKLVMNGILVLDFISDALMRAVERCPTNLAGKIIVGATKTASSGWKQANTNITHVNIFSKVLPVKAMKAKTEHKFKDCEESGDYLSWNEMEWEMHGDITTHIIDSDQPCKNESDILLYYTKFKKMSDCMYHCKKLGGRAPKVVTEEDWHRLQRFMNNNYYSKVEFTQGLWLSVTDEDKEGDWKDFYSRELMKHKGPFTGAGPDGGDHENCALQVSHNSWVDTVCDVRHYSNFCACSHEKRPLLRLRGLCSSSSLETLYIPRSSVSDLRSLHYVGEKGAVVYYDEQQKQWSLINHEVIGHSISSKGSYVLNMINIVKFKGRPHILTPDHCFLKEASRMSCVNPKILIG